MINILTIDLQWVDTNSGMHSRKLLGLWHSLAAALAAVRTKRENSVAKQRDGPPLLLLLRRHIAPFTCVSKADGFVKMNSALEIPDKPALTTITVHYMD